MDNWDSLNNLRCGLPTTTATSIFCNTIEDEEEYSFDANGNENNNENNEDNENLVERESEESLVEKDGERTGSSKTTLIVLKNVTEMFVNNKRKLLEKNSVQVNMINST